MNTNIQPSRAAFALWLGIACLAGAWFLAVRFYGSPAPQWSQLWLCLTVAGALLLSFARMPLPKPRTAGIAALLLLPASAILGWPESVGLWMAVTGLALSTVAARFPIVGALSRGALLAGAIWLIQGLVMFLYSAWTARMAIMPEFLQETLAFLARAAGIQIAVDEGQLVLFSMRTKHAVAATWTMFVDPVTINFLAGGMAFLLLNARKRWRPVILFASTMGAWLVVRAVLLMSIYLHRALRTGYDEALSMSNQFWHKGFALAFILPAVVVAWCCVRGSWRTGGDQGGAGAPIPDPAPGANTGARPVAAGAVLFAAVVAITMAVVWHPSGPRKGGRILIDEYHCDLDLAKDPVTGRPRIRDRWPQKEFDTTSTLRPFSKDWHGEASGYNYASIYALCSRYFDMSQQKTPINAAALKNVDVLVLKVPSIYYEQEEIDAVLDFVKRGGGLLLLGEHTSVFGSGVPLNQVAKHFGFKFRYDCLFGMDDKFQQEFDETSAPHPAIQYMGPLDLAVSCSIDPGSSSGVAVMRGSALKSLDADYFASNFYPSPAEVPEMLHGSFVQLWATEYGEGRVLAFTDSTIFANFAIYERGKSELFLGMMEWLNYGQGLSRWWVILLGLGLSFGAVVMLVRANLPWPVLLGVTVLGWASGTGLTLVLHQSDIPPLQARRPLVKVEFDRALCTSTQTPKGGFIGGKEDVFGLFERAFQRLTRPQTDLSNGPVKEVDEGRTWMTVRTEGGPPKDADLMVFIYPSEKPSEEYRRQLTEYVERGGKLLVLDSAYNKTSTANELLTSFGLSVDRSTTLEGKKSEVAEGMPPLPPKDALPVQGGTPFVRFDGKPVATWVRRGEGLVVLLGCGSRFCDANMGVSAQEPPNAEVTKVFEFQYSLLEAIDKGDFPNLKN